MMNKYLNMLMKIDEEILSVIYRLYDNTLRNLVNR